MSGSGEIELNEEIHALEMSCTICSFHVDMSAWGCGIPKDVHPSHESEDVREAFTEGTNCGLREE